MKYNSPDNKRIYESIFDRRGHSNVKKPVIKYEYLYMVSIGWDDNVKTSQDKRNILRGDDAPRTYATKNLIDIDILANKARLLFRIFPGIEDRKGSSKGVTVVKKKPVNRSLIKIDYGYYENPDEAMGTRRVDRYTNYSTYFFFQSYIKDIFPDIYEMSVRDNIFYLLNTSQKWEVYLLKVLDYIDLQVEDKASKAGYEFYTS